MPASAAASFHVGRFMLPTGHHAGKGSTKDRRKPKQPELCDVGATGKQRRSGAPRRVDRGVSDRDEEKVNECQTEADRYLVPN
jgi:hypothetical protein